MGNISSKKAAAPSVYYSPSYGVTLGNRPPSLELDEVQGHGDDEVMKEEGTRLKPCHQVSTTGNFPPYLKKQIINPYYINQQKVKKDYKSG